MTQCVPAEGYIYWINLIFGDCVYSTQEAISVLLGYLSIVCWLNAQLPQVIENYKIASVDSLSINFLTIWLAGDAANLIGCILTHQLPFQRYLGIYFVFIDVALLVQWIYYTHKNNKRSRSRNRKNTTDDPLSRVFQHPSARTPLLIDGKSLEDELAPCSASSSPSKWYTLNDTANSSDTTLTNSNRTKTLMVIMLLGFRLTTSSSGSSNLVTTTLTAAAAAAAADSNDGVLAVQDNALVIGRIFAWVCTTLYLLSRIPQIHKNFKRKSIDGLSPTLFICAACGNLTYTASILSNPNQTSESLVEAIPYLIGSAGTLCFDFTIFCQFLWYWRRGNNKRHHHHHLHSNHVTTV
ncbi:PQ loop repeat-domain-containing protein [Zychaea mexicana]|uniref:PQ loop repeat-domain-containing protein n=1 Tax=Zychaea mexicana TaxID=64656 RepID=UPI0022FE394A|nr:PQ loop repeat-domain-containing protein [Zychaea mexicana]KAI9497352.1 PQ loop repeat-domain-containing protein [Zychaea mexicana]